MPQRMFYILATIARLVLLAYVVATLPFLGNYVLLIILL